VKWISDTSGRFEWRPYYDQVELDNECEQLVAAFLRTKYGTYHFPLSTDDLSVMIEQNVSDLDLYADLANYGEDVEGLTDFFPNKKPAVKITRELSLDNSRYHRLRTTLAHEFGHVKFHSFLWDFNRASLPGTNIKKKIVLQRHRYAQLRQTFSPLTGLNDATCSLQNNTDSELFSDVKSGSCFRCKRGRMLDAPLSDWMEWQAGYICGAVLMPLSPLQALLRKILAAGNGRSWVPAGSDSAQESILLTAEEFDVSIDAARVRLLKLGFIQ
jgi:Zn-dependent peptidase ImmA (M78 family)